LVFDDATEDKLFELIDTLGSAGVSPTLLDFDDRPHISLAFFEADNPTQMMRKLKGAAKKLRQVPLKFESIGVFHKTGVVFLSPAPTQALLRTHQAIHRVVRPALKKTFCESADYYCVDDLAFHCTLALRLTPARIIRSVTKLLGETFPRSVMGVALRLVVLPEGKKAMAQELALHPLRPPKK